MLRRKHSRIAMEIATMSRVKPKPGKNGISNWPPLDPCFVRKAIKYFPNAAVKAGKNTLVPTTNDNRGSLTQANIAIKERGTRSEKRCTYPNASGMPKCLRRHCLETAPSPWTCAKFTGNSIFSNKSRVSFMSSRYAPVWETPAQMMLDTVANASSWFRRTALCFRFTEEAPSALIVADKNNATSLPI